MPETRDAFRLPLDALLSSLATDPRTGLSTEEARRRLGSSGRNELDREAPVPGWRRFLAQFQDVLVLLLLVATGISAVLWSVERDAALPYEAIAILAVVLLNAAMGYVQESRAAAAMAALRAMSAAEARVVRGGEHGDHGHGRLEGGGRHGARRRQLRHHHRCHRGRSAWTRPIET